MFSPEGRDLIDELGATGPQAAQTADRFHPAKHLFDQRAFALADGIAASRVVRPSIALCAFCATCGVISSARTPATKLATS